MDTPADYRQRNPGKVPDEYVKLAQRFTWIVAVWFFVCGIALGIGIKTIS